MRITRKSFLLLIGGVLIALCAVSTPDTVYAQTRKKHTAQKKEVVAGKKKKVQGKKKANAVVPQSNASASEMKRQQQAAEQEIRETKKKISENDKAVKANLNDLQKIGQDIEVSRKQINDISTQVNSLDTDIRDLEKDIASGEAEVARLRAAYLKAVKKMRLNRSGNSKMAFLFSAKSFNEMLRRFRYMKKFSEWKERQTAEISSKVNELKKDRESLASAKQQKNRALSKEIKVKENLSAQQRQKDALVADLRANGAALQSHLARKQQEANALKGQISALIAREEQAAREKKMREEAEAKAKAERLAEQKRIEEERAAEAPAAKEKADQEAKAKAESGKDKKKKSEPAKDKGKKGEDKKQEASKKDKKSKGTKDYATARNRKGRSEKAQEAPKASQPAPKKETPQQPSSSSGNFEGSKGRLPHPCSGSFRIVSPFGRHAVPGLPDVVYDNPGIDAETSAGSSAQAVFGGKVSGVYVVPGYSTVIIVNHGDYYTVYGNIASPSVKTGDSVKAGQSLGKLTKDTEDNTTKIHFEVWKNRNKLNPAEWIR